MKFLLWPFRAVFMALAFVVMLIVHSVLAIVGAVFSLIVNGGILFAVLFVIALIVGVVI